MSSLVLSGDTSGQVSLTVPAVAGSNTITVQAATGTMSVNTLATAVATTSGTSITFSSLPAWVKRITVMFNGVSTSGTSPVQIQIGSGSATTSGYVGSFATMVNAAALGISSFTTGFNVPGTSAADVRTGHMLITNISGNIWVATVMTSNSSTATTVGGSVVTISGTLDRVVLTTVNGTDTFDAGSVNILYEG
jgi:hypothetical protein